VVEDAAILFGLSLIYLAMLAMIITLARFFASEEGHGPRRRPLSRRAETDLIQ